MKRLHWLPLSFCFLYSLGCHSPAPQVSSSPLVVQNPGFENLVSSRQPAGWSSLPDQSWGIDPNIPYSGEYSLRVQNQDPSWYKYMYQEIVVEPQKSYRIGLWCRAEGLSHSNQSSGGATFCVEYLGKDWAWLGGEYDVPKLQGTCDWQYLSLKEIIIPSSWMGKQVEHINLCLFLTRGTTGTAWFDDLSIEEIPPPLLETFLLQPNYRSLLITEISPQIQLQVNLRPETAAHEMGNTDLKDLQINLTLEDQNGKTVKDTIYSLHEALEFKLALDLPQDLPQGSYLLKTSLYDKKKREYLAETTEELKNISLATRDALSVSIDQYNRVLCQGEPFFPLGIYTANTDYASKEKRREEIEKIADSEFNTLLNYNTTAPLSWINEDFAKDKAYAAIREYLDLLTEHDLRVCFVPSIKLFTTFGPNPQEDEIKEIVSNLKDHPALLGWYVNDEVGPGCLEELIAYNKTVQDQDQDHPTWSVHYHLEYLRRMIPTSDIIGTDPYPVPSTPVNYVAQASEAAYQAGRGARPFWIVIQTHGPPGRPTEQEVRCMTYLALIHKACGLFYYSYFEIWKEPPVYDASARWEWLKKIAGEVKILEHIILSIEDIPGSGLTCSAPAVHFLLKRHQNNFYLLMVNSSYERLQATFKGSDQMAITQPVVDFLQQENLLQETSTPPVAINNQFKVTLNRLEARVYSWPAPTNGEE